MKKIQIFLSIAVLFLLGGCVGSTNYYVLSNPSQPSVVYAKQNKIIGVEKVTLPAYLFKRQIAIAKSASQIAFMSGYEWGEDLDEGLTNRLISFLQKKFREPRVYAYPWQTDKVPTQRVKVNITRFIAYGDKVYLDANWEIIDRSGRSRSRLFNTSVAIQSGNSASIVASMDAAFRQFEESLANGLKSF